MSAPKVGQCYAKAGFLFRIDDVSATHVYVCRMKEGGGLLCPMRVSHRTWNKEMRDAKQVADKVSTPSQDSREGGE